VADLWTRYQASALGRGLPVMARRTFCPYRKRLETAGILRVRQGPGRGNTRIVEVME